MKWGLRGRVLCVPALVSVVLAALTLGGCNTTEGPFASTSTPRSASIAFDSIDGPPPEIFQRLVRDLNTEAQNRQVTVLSRNQEAAYRVRGYLGAQTKGSESSITWVWDVYDGERQRVLRVSGEEKVKGKHANAWTALDDIAIQRIARNSMEQLGAFLKSPDTAPAAQPAAATEKEGSPESEGIVRISTPQADPLQTTASKSPIQKPRPVTVAQGAVD